MKSLSAFLGLPCLLYFTVATSFAGVSIPSLDSASSGISSFSISGTAIPVKDVYIKGYYRKDGTYVRPHIRSSPNKYKWDNYGPSRRDSELLNPRSRDNDGDGIPNYLDRDDNNNSILDDYDPNQYSPSYQYPSDFYLGE